MICRRTESNDILLELVARTLAVGAYEMQVEYEDRTAGQGRGAPLGLRGQLRHGVQQVGAAAPEK